MTTPKTTIWDKDPHTDAKHQILACYLDAWFPIITKFGGLTYADGFAGPNEYSDGDPGSPAIALQRACRETVVATNVPMRVVLVERDADRHQHLDLTLERDFPESGRPTQLRVDTTNGTCEDDLVPRLTAVGAWGKPIFANLDGWGVDVPYEVVRRVGSNVASEVMVTMKPEFFLRFASGEQQAGDRVFGTSAWRRVDELSSPSEKRAFLINSYREALTIAGFQYSLVFEMLDEGGHRLYLFFGTSNETGLAKMKDAMWNADPSYGTSFRDPRDPSQLAFHVDQPQLAPLETELLSVLATTGPVPLEALRRHTLLSTIYKKKHATDAARTMRDDGRLVATAGRLTAASLVEAA